MSSAIVVDLGSSAVKCGLANSYLTDTQPSVVTSTTLATASATDGTQPGGSVQAIRDGQVADWAALERILHDALYMQLGWEVGEEGNLLIAEPLCTPRDDREQLAQLAFEVFNVSGLFFADQALLSLYSVGKSTGLVIDFGHTKTDVSMVVDGLLYLPSVRRLPFGGRDVTEHLQRLLAARGVVIDDPGTVQGLKEGCATAEDDQTAEEGGAAFGLPDGRDVTISAEEAAGLAACMLQPSLAGANCPSVVETAAASVFTHLDPAVRRTALDSVLVCGGGSAVSGLTQKLCRELRQLLPPAMTPVAATVPEYMPAATLQHSSWMGGAVLSKILMQHNHYMSKGEYEEYGPAVVHRKTGA